MVITTLVVVNIHIIAVEGSFLVAHPSLVANQEGTSLEVGLAVPSLEVGLAVPSLEVGLVVPSLAVVPSFVVVPSLAVVP